MVLQIGFPSQPVMNTRQYGMVREPELLLLSSAAHHRLSALRTLSLIGIPVAAVGINNPPLPLSAGARGPADASVSELRPSLARFLKV